jgi:serine protease Do
MFSKRNLILVLVLCFSLTAFTGCFEENNNSFATSSEGAESDSNQESSIISEESYVESKEENSKVSEAVSQMYETPEEYIRYGFADAVEKVADTVVAITVVKSYNGGFFGEQTSYENGSGVVISESGYIVTNCHVVDEAKSIKVTLSDSSEYEATLVGKDKRTDLAVIKVERESHFEYASLADSSSLRMGDFVFAIGNALGKYQGSVTMGIISSVSRNVTVNGEEMEMLQTDAALNSGNSGGGLFDSHGFLVGIVAAKDTNSEAEGVGFAIPSDVAKKVISELITNGYVTGRPTLGFETVDITSMREAAYYGVEWIGVYISSVEKNSHGETAGLKSRDYIYSVNGEVITNTDRLLEILDSSSVGDTLFLEIWRGKDSFDVILMIGEEVG